MDPRVQDSYRSSGCSPQGLVASMAPRWGVGLAALIRSRKTTPGSPVAQAACTSRSNTIGAGSRLAAFPVRGLTRA